MREALTKKEHEMYMYIDENKVDNCTYTDLARKMNIDVSLVRKRILSLQAKGYLFRSGTLIKLLKG